MPYSHLQTNKLIVMSNTQIKKLIGSVVSLYPQLRTRYFFPQRDFCEFNFYMKLLFTLNELFMMKTSLCRSISWQRHIVQGLGRFKFLCQLFTMLCFLFELFETQSLYLHFGKVNKNIRLLLTLTMRFGINVYSTVHLYLQKFVNERNEYLIHFIDAHFNTTTTTEFCFPPQVSQVIPSFSPSRYKLNSIEKNLQFWRWVFKLQTLSLLVFPFN